LLCQALELREGERSSVPGVLVHSTGRGSANL
jgi:hypothetical protein